jgi:hypothetical protein
VVQALGGPADIVEVEGAGEAVDEAEQVVRLPHGADDVGTRMMQHRDRNVQMKVGCEVPAPEDLCAAASRPSPTRARAEEGRGAQAAAPPTAAAPRRRQTRA